MRNLKLLNILLFSLILESKKVFDGKGYLIDTYYYKDFEKAEDIINSVFPSTINY